MENLWGKKQICNNRTYSFEQFPNFVQWTGVQEKNVATQASQQRNVKQEDAVSIHMLLVLGGASALLLSQVIMDNVR